MEVRIHIPQRGAGLIQAIFEQQGHEEIEWCILPNGQVNLIFLLNGDAHLTGARSMTSVNDPLRHEVFLSGLHTKPLRMRYTALHVMGVAMSPVAVKALFGIPASEIRDGAVEGALLRPALVAMKDRLHDLPNFRERALFLENELLRMVDESADLHLAMHIAHTADVLAQRHPLANDDHLEALLGFSRTHSFRLSNTWFGCSLHGSQRLRQFVHAVELLHSSDERLTAIGLDAGYFDQAHFVRSFRAFADMTPGEYRRRMSATPGQLAC